MTNDRLIRRKEVESITSLSKSSIYSYINSGQFPRPLVLGRGAVRWRLSDISNWMEQLRERLSMIVISNINSVWSFGYEAARYYKSYSHGTG